ncbi:MAG TPA: L-threonylcarbamoyladenylate synthase [Candidatus Nanoarchaeia archaeon]|nr:putative protein YciO [uncultured archaeon]
MDSLERAVEVLKAGGIVIYPTETVYAVGCLISFPKSIEKLYKIKQRDQNQPTSALVPSLQVAQEYVSFNRTARKLAKAFWPGPLTLCLPCTKDVPEMILGPQRSLGMRVPGSKWVLELLQMVKVPILAPSANFKDKLSPTKPTEIDKNLVKLVDYVVELVPEGQKPSTIMTFNNNTKEPYQVIREGNIKKEMIAEVLEKGD